MEEKRHVETTTLALDTLLRMTYGLIRDLDILAPEERNKAFLVKNLKAGIEYRIALTKDRNPELANELDRLFDELYHESFPAKKKSPLLIPPSSLPDVRAPDPTQDPPEKEG